MNAVSSGLRKLHRMLRPLVQITDPPVGVVFDHDVAVPVRDGVVLRANVFRPRMQGRYPVLLCAHPYGKDTLPRPRRGGGYRIPLQYRMLSQDQRVSHSAWTSWEAPDPGFWVPRGYVVINADLRGWGHSDGTGELFSAQEGEDCYDLIEWAAKQPWSNGRVGMTGVSYLAISQWRAAATRPPHLAAINPWEGFTDLYRDFTFPGGIREDGFSIAWDRGLSHRSNSPVKLRDNMLRRPLIDDWWLTRNPDLERIEVPALVCASFSDHCLHSGGSFEGFRRISSTQKWLYTHRRPKWATYYSREALQLQSRFFDYFLRGENTGMEHEPAVRIEIHSETHTIAAVTTAPAWPPPNLVPITLHADVTHHTLTTAPAQDRAQPTHNGRLMLRHRFEQLTDVVGPIRLSLHISADRDDMTLFAGIRKYSGGREVCFEGSYGLDHDLVSHGWLRASHRATDTGHSTTWNIQHHHTSREPLVPGQITRLDLSLLPSATRFEAGAELVLELSDHWFYPTNLLTGSVPARYHCRRTNWRLHTGSAHPTTLTIPVLPQPSQTNS